MGKGVECLGLRRFASGEVRLLKMKVAGKKIGCKTSSWTVKTDPLTYKGKPLYLCDDRTAATCEWKKFVNPLTITARELSRLTDEAALRAMMKTAKVDWLMALLLIITGSFITLVLQAMAK